MSSTKRIQGKLFRGEPGGDGGSDPAKSGSLTIDIPTSTLQTKSVQPLKTSKPAERVEVDNDVPGGRYTVPYRDRLLQRLGSEYHGTERYRLEADRKKEVHWKKWGPYLSDRQWVHLPRLRAIKDSENDSVFRQPSERIILTTVMLGITFLTSTHVQELIDGEKMALLASPITINACVWRYHCGTARTASLKSVSLV